MPKQECPEYVEKYVCLSKWRELLPTDGTHIEVVQSSTSACDHITHSEIEDANKLRKLVIASEEQDIQIKKRALVQIRKTADVQIRIDTEGTPGQP